MREEAQRRKERKGCHLFHQRWLLAHITSPKFIASLLLSKGKIALNSHNNLINVLHHLNGDRVQVSLSLLDKYLSWARLEWHTQLRAVADKGTIEVIQVESGLFHLAREQQEWAVSIIASLPKEVTWHPSCSAMKRPKLKKGTIRATDWLAI